MKSLAVEELVVWVKSIEEEFGVIALELSFGGKSWTYTDGDFIGDGFKAIDDEVAKKILKVIRGVDGLKEIIKSAVNFKEYYGLRYVEFQKDKVKIIVSGITLKLISFEFVD